MSPRLVFALVIALLLLSACSVFDSSQPAVSPTPVVELPPTLTPTPAPPQTGDTIAISWTQVTPQPHETERLRPFEDAVRENDSEGEDRWRAYSVQGTAEPRLELETHRYLHSLYWTQDGSAMVLGYWTRYESRPNDFVGGGQALRPGASVPLWDLRLPGVFYLPRNASEYVALANSSVAGQVLLRSDGTLWTLTSSLANTSAGGWSPDGRGLLFSQYDSQRDDEEFRFYVTQPLANSATLVSTAPYGVGPAWSPDSARLAFDTGAGVSVFDVARGSIDAIPGSGPFSGFLDWSDDGRYVLQGDGLIDLETKRTVIARKDRSIIDAALSPDNRWLAVTLDFNQGSHTTCNGPGLRNQTFLIDVASGAERALFDCDRFLTRLRWLDNEHFLAYTHTCWACEGKSLLFLVSIADGSATPLSSDFTYWARYDISPDGRQMLVSGDEVRLYSIQGQLLRRISVEPGYTVIEVKWAPDGSGFAYLVGPKDVVFV